MKKYFILGVLICSCSIVFGQAQWNWPKNVAKAKEQNVIYSDAVKSKEWARAVDAHKWLLDSCPDLNASIYINGTKIYEGLAKAEKDPAKKKEYAEMALKMYDDRIKYFNNEKKVINRKVFTYYKYFKKDISRYDDLMATFDKAYEMNKEKILINNLKAYMDFIKRYKKSGKEISDEEIIDKYSMISDIIDHNISIGKKVDHMNKVQEYIDNTLSSLVNVDCDFIESNLVPKMRETKDPKLANKVFKLMLSAKCSDQPSFLEAAEIVYANNQTFGLAKVLGAKYGAAKNNEKSHAFFDAAIELAENNTDKAEVYYMKAQSLSTAGMKSGARMNARKAVSFDPNLNKAYVLIGNLYFTSGTSCNKGVSRVDDRLIYLAAYKQYQKGGDTKAMDKAKQQFPSMEEIFNEGLEIGQMKTIGCWINETVALEKRP